MMLRDDLTDPRSGQSPPSFEAAIAELRAALTASRADPESSDQVTALVAQLGRAAKAQDVKSEAAVVALRTEWEREVAGAFVLAAGGTNAKLLRAIGLLLHAYYGDQ